MAGRSVPNLGQNSLGSGAKPGGASGLVPAGQGSNTLVTRGGPPPVQLVKHTQGHNGATTVNSQPVR